MTAEIKPGEKLPTEVEFMERLGVGRNSVREAIKMLAVMGVLEVRRGNGTYIATEVSPAFFNPLIFSLALETKSFYDLYELRMMFENMVMLLAIEKSTDEELERIEKLLIYTKELADNNSASIDEFVKLDVDFHAELIKAAHNPLIDRIGKAIIELFPNYIKKSLSQKNGIQRSINNHFEILNVLKSREKSKVFEIIEGTLSEWKNQ